MEKLTLGEVRRMRNISKEEMAKHLGIHRNTYSNWEENPQNISMSYAKMICEYLNVSSDMINFFEVDSTKRRV